MYNKHRVEKVLKKGKVVKEVLCTPEPFANSAGMLLCLCCREIQSLHRGSVSRCTLPPWASFAEDVFILSPTSAAVERLFSLLCDKFDDKSKQSLMDYITASLMLRGNMRQLCP